MTSFHYCPFLLIHHVDVKALFNIPTLMFRHQSPTDSAAVMSVWLVKGVVVGGGGRAHFYFTLTLSQGTEGKYFVL